MDFKRIFAGLVAASAAVCAFTGCEANEQLGEPEVKLSEKTITLEAGEDSATIELTSTLDWTLKDYESVRSWLTVSPTSGKASNDPQKITISATANDGKARPAEIVFYGNKLKQATLSITQKGTIGSGDGSKENPFSASEAHAYVLTLAADVATEQAYYVKGFVKKFSNTNADDMPKFGNATFWITDDASGEGDDFYCYRVKGPGNKSFTSADQLALGDEVIVYAKFINYKGNTPETKDGFVYSINGESEGDDPGPVVPITGNNLLTTGSFEVWNDGKPEGWASLAASNATISQSTEAVDGSSSVEIKGTKSDNKRFHSDPILLKAGTYQFSVYAAGSGVIRLGYIASWNSDGSVNGGNMGANYVYLLEKSTVTSAWTNYSVQFTLAADSKVSLFITASKNDPITDVCVDEAVLVTKDGGIADSIDDGGEDGEGGGGDTPVDMPYDALDINNFVEGYYVIAYTTGGKTYLMKNEVKAQYYVAAEEFDLANSTIEDFTEDIVFYVSEGEEGYLIENMDGGFVACQVSGTHYNLVPSVTTPYEWNFANGSNGAIIATGGNSNGNCISYNASYTEYNMYSQTTSCPTFYLIQEGGGEGGIEQCADAFYYEDGGQYWWTVNLYGYDYDTENFIYPDVYLDFPANVGQDSTCIAGSYTLDEYSYIFVDENDMTGSDIVSGTIDIAVVEEGDDYYYPVYYIKVDATFAGGIEYKEEYEIPIYAFSGYPGDYTNEFYLDDKLAQKTKALAAHKLVNRRFNAHKLMPAKPVRTR